MVLYRARTDAPRREGGFVADGLAGLLESSEAERLATGFTFTEGPLWHPDGFFYFVDLRVHRLHTIVPGQAAKLVRENTGEGNGTTFDFKSLHENISAPTDPKFRAIIGDVARSLGLSTRVMPSGAGHDAQSMAVLGPIGMIFIPSVGGISHSPKEFSRPEDIVNGANVLLGAVLALDRL